MIFYSPFTSILDVIKFINWRGVICFLCKIHSYIVSAFFKIIILESGFLYFFEMRNISAVKLSLSFLCWMYIFAFLRLVFTTIMLWMLLNLIYQCQKGKNYRNKWLVNISSIMEWSMCKETLFVWIKWDEGKENLNWFISTQSFYF